MMSNDFKRAELQQNLRRMLIVLVDERSMLSTEFLATMETDCSEICSRLPEQRNKPLGRNSYYHYFWR